MALLQVREMRTHYGAIKAVKGVSFEVNEGEIVTLIGSNGAGKSTTLNTIAGLVPMASGAVLFDGADISGMPAHERVKRGITLAPEGRQVFPELTVEGNLRMGGYTVDRQAMEEGMDQAFQLFPRLAERRKQHAGTLSGGEQQMLALGRALMAKPRLLMLDEPSLGLAPLIVVSIFKLVEHINRLGTTILLVEQNARMALGISSRGYVLETGRIVLAGSGSELAVDDRVRGAYLGG